MSALAKAIASGNVNLSSNADGELMEISATQRAAQVQHAESLLHVEARRRQRAIVVPTREEEIRAAFRELGKVSLACAHARRRFVFKTKTTRQPITLFGERLTDKRERLRLVLAEKEIAGFDVQAFLARFGAAAAHVEAAAEDIVQQREVFHTPASDALLVARQQIAELSWGRARARLIRESIAVDPLSTTTMTIVASQIGDRRPLSCCAQSPDGEYCVVGSWSETCKVWRVADFVHCKTLLGHTDRVVDVQFRPTNGGDMVASGSADATVRLWRVGQDGGDSAVGPAHTMTGHVQRISRVAWDCTGSYVASTSFDHTWRLWDAATGKELVTQDGHARQTYALAFHPDGALVCTGDMGGVGRVWDIRTSKTVMPLQGHLLGVLASDFHRDGWRLATGGLDNQVRVWDLRKGRCMQMLQLHAKTIPHVKWAPVSGGYLATASHDRTVKFWSSVDYKPLAVCDGHEGPVFGCSISPVDDFKVMTCSYDRTIKQWGARAPRPSSSGNG